MNGMTTFTTGMIFLFTIFLVVGLSWRGIFWIVFVLFILSILVLRSVAGEISKKQEMYFLLFLSLVFIAALFSIKLGY